MHAILDIETVGELTPALRCRGGRAARRVDARFRRHAQRVAPARPRDSGATHRVRELPALGRRPERVLHQNTRPAARPRSGPARRSAARPLTRRQASGAGRNRRLSRWAPRRSQPFRPCRRCPTTPGASSTPQTSTWRNRTIRVAGSVASAAGPRSPDRDARRPLEHADHARARAGRGCDPVRAAACGPHRRRPSLAARAAGRGHRQSHGPPQPARLRRAAARGDRPGRALGTSPTVVLTDCDDLKHVNDRFGRDGGDALLQGLARVLRHGKRVSDVAGRVGGDEFGLLLPEADAAVAAAVVERLRVSIHELRSGGSHTTASFGIAVSPTTARRIGAPPRRRPSPLRGQASGQGSPGRCDRVQLSCRPATTPGRRRPGSASAELRAAARCARVARQADPRRASRRSAVAPSAIHARLDPVQEALLLGVTLAGVRPVGEQAPVDIVRHARVIGTPGAESEPDLLLSSDYGSARLKKACFRLTATSSQPSLPSRFQRRASTGPLAAAPFDSDLEHGRSRRGVLARPPATALLPPCRVHLRHRARAGRFETRTRERISKRGRLLDDPERVVVARFGIGLHPTEPTHARTRASQPRDRAVNCPRAQRRS